MAHAGSALQDLLSGALPGKPATLLGLVGPPGVGKTYTTQRIVERLGSVGVAVAVVPMDGFHLSNAQLEDIGIGDRKGSPDTFDVDGLVALLSRIRSGAAAPIFVPDYDRDIHEPVAARRRIDPDTRLVIVEGNYLLHDELGWAQVGGLLDQTWYLDIDSGVREERLLQRQISGGKSRDTAVAWVQRVDRKNAEVISRGRSRASHILDAGLVEAQLEEAMGVL